MIEYEQFILESTIDNYKLVNNEIFALNILGDIINVIKLLVNVPFSYNKSKEDLIVAIGKPSYTVMNILVCLVLNANILYLFISYF